jgi:hypothetical protein
VFLLGFGALDRLVEPDDSVDMDRDAGFAVEYGGDETFVDDDEYLEYEVSWEHGPEPVTHTDDTVTEPMQSRADHLRHTPAEDWRSAPAESRRYLPSEDGREQPAAEPRSILRPINGFYVDEEQRYQPLPPPAPEEIRPSRHERPARHRRADNEPQTRQSWFESNGSHSRGDGPDGAPRYGRHSTPRRD